MTCDAGLSKCKKIFLAVVFTATVVMASLYCQFRQTAGTLYSVKQGTDDRYGTREGTHHNISTAWNNGFLTTAQTDFGADEIPDKYSPADFDINGTDVMVFLHMQKTGGTGFGRNLVSNMNIQKECNVLEHKKRRDCMRPNSDSETWIFSRYSTGWVCGLHADWTELTECVADKMNKLEQPKERRYFYITVLRKAVKRYISEWKHVQRGATWRDSTYSCKGHKNDIPKCYSGDNWRGVTLTEFMSCPYNMANNRQTRMLADLRLVKCYEMWLKNENLDATQIHELENIMLMSAKKNLQEMSFFGLLEKQRELQKLFEYTFPFAFKTDLLQLNVTRISTFFPTDDELKRIEELNRLDSELYDFASRLFEQRYRKIRT